MRAFVTGGTGFLGFSLARQLLADGHRVRVLVRSAAKAAPLVELGAEAVSGDITDRTALAAAAADADVIYHMVGRLHAPGVPTTEYYRTHVDGTVALLACCRGTASLGRLVYVSTTGVLGVTGDQPADENAPYAPTNAYEDSKLQAELLVRQAINEGLPVVIVRPGMVYGPGDMHLLGFYRTIQRGLFEPIGRRPVWLSVIYIADMVNALLCCGQHPGALGECFHIAHPRPVTLAALATAIAEAMGVRASKGAIPLPLAKLAATLGDLLPPRLSPMAPLTHARLDFLTHSRVYNVTKMQQCLGFSAGTELSVGLGQTVTWYRQQGFLPASASRPAEQPGLQQP